MLYGSHKEATTKKTERKQDTITFPATFIGEIELQEPVEPQSESQDKDSGPSIFSEPELWEEDELGFGAVELAVDKRRKK